MKEARSLTDFVSRRSHCPAQAAAAREHDGLSLCQMHTYHHELRHGGKFSASLRIPEDTAAPAAVNCPTKSFPLTSLILC